MSAETAKLPPYKVIPLAELIPYVNNSRTHSEDQVAQVAASIREFGFTNPVLIDGDNGIVGGHCRVLAARKLGLTEVPVIELSHLTEAQRKAYVIADNQLALNAGWNLDLLKLELADLKELDFDLSLMGFSDEQLANLMVEPTAGLTEPDAVPDTPVTPVSATGDVWLCGPHRVMCGDATSLDDVERLMGGVGADIYLTDPPYNVAYEGKTKDALRIENDKQGDSEFRQFLHDAFVSADAVMKPGAVFYIWHADSEGYNFRGACNDIGWKVRQCLIWAKSSMVLGRQDYQWRHEPCLYGWKGGAGHLWATDRKQTTLLQFDKPSRSADHPTMKPVALFEYQMLNNTKGQDVVLDTFGGSGTTLIAAETHGRFARLMELDPRYCDVIVKRWEAFTGREATREADGVPFASLRPKEA